MQTTKMLKLELILEFGFVTNIQVKVEYLGRKYADVF